MEVQEKQQIDLSQLSAEELERLLEEKKKKEAEVQKRKRREYEARKDALVKDLTERAKELHELMRETKSYMLRRLNEFKEQMEEYGGIRSNSKGGFSLRSGDGKFKVVWERNVKSEYDERAQEAENLIRDFLTDFIKKRDKDTYELIMSLLEKNKRGDFNPARIASLLKHEDRFNDQRWRRAMQLFKESYNVVEVSYSIAFYEKDETGKDRHISLSFPSIKTEEEV